MRAASGGRAAGVRVVSSASAGAGAGAGATAAAAFPVRSWRFGRSLHDGGHASAPRGRARGGLAAVSVMNNGQGRLGGLSRASVRLSVAPSRRRVVGEASRCKCKMLMQNVAAAIEVCGNNHFNLFVILKSFQVFSFA